MTAPGHGVPIEDRGAMRAVMAEGARAVAPILLGVLPFSLIVGFAAVDVGMTGAQAIGYSLIVFAGASQLAAIDLISRDGAVVVIVMTMLVINARFLMYSASLAPVLRRLPRRTTLGAAYLLTDQAFAVSAVRFSSRDEPVHRRLAFYLGAGLPLWATWQTGTIIGVVAGAGIPASWSLDFAVPLVFIALLVPAVRDRIGAVTAVTAALTAVLAGGLPYNAGLLVAAGVGIAAGMVLPKGGPS